MHALRTKVQCGRLQCDFGNFGSKCFQQFNSVQRRIQHSTVLKKQNRTPDVLILSPTTESTKQQQQQKPLVCK